MTEMEEYVGPFQEAYHEYGEVICEGCETAVDLSGAATLAEATDVWNEHVRDVHGETDDN